MLHRLLAALGFLVALWLVAVALLFVWPRANDAPPAHADVVVVLSGGGNWRLDPALKMMRRGGAPVLAISSVAKTPRWRKAQKLCRGGYRTKYRIVCFEALPYSTRGEAETVSRLAHRYGWHRLVVVTSTYHVTRARVLFRRCFHGELWTVGTSSPWTELPLEWASETAKLVEQAAFERGC